MKNNQGVGDLFSFMTRLKPNKYPVGLAETSDKQHSIKLKYNRSIVDAISYLKLIMQPAERYN